MTILWRGVRVTVRDLRPDDVPVIWHWRYAAEDLEHHQWNGPYGPVEVLELEEFWQQHGKRMIQDVEELSPTRALVIDADGKLIGQVSCYWVDERTNWLEIGIVIYDSRYWSGGYGTEAFGFWIHHLFQTLDLVRLGIATWSGNERMMRLAARWGMVEEARVRKARIVRGEFYDSVKMGLLREEWDEYKFLNRSTTRFDERQDFTTEYRIKR
jgi:RimJ/RimL family protein N-acetyltransferase